MVSRRKSLRLFKEIATMQTQLTPSALRAVRLPPIIDRFGRKRVVIASAALALISGLLAWQWSWLAAIGVAPLLVSAAPCVAMCALGLCAQRICSHSGPTAPKSASQDSSSQQEI
jgi:hypothetical protein